MLNPLDHTTVVSQTQPFIELNNHGEILRFQLQEEQYQLGRDRTSSNLEIPKQTWDVLSRRQAVLQREGDYYRIYDGDGNTPSQKRHFYSSRSTRGARLSAQTRNAIRNWTRSKQSHSADLS